MLLETDKIGRFAEIPRPLFDEKVQEFVSALFASFSSDWKVLKRVIVTILIDSELLPLLRRVRAETSSSLAVKFFLQNHKPNLPLRVVNIERDHRRKQVSSFIKECLVHIS